MHRLILSAAAVILLAGCGRPSEPAANVIEPPAPAAAAPPPVSGAPGTPGGLPDDRTPLNEPKGPIAPDSDEAAGQLAQLYGGLLEQKKFAEARALWGNNGNDSGQSEAAFAGQFAAYQEIHAEVGRPSAGEGAAGSVFSEVPFRLYGTGADGKSFNRIGALIMRRVNQVPGATEEQLRWHIVEAKLRPAG